MTIPESAPVRRNFFARKLRHARTGFCSTLSSLVLGIVTTAAAESFLPLGVWVQDPANAARYQAAGINTYVGLWQGPTAAQLTALQPSGMRIICSQNETALRHPAAANIIAWMHGDEPDNTTKRGARLGLGNPIPPAEIIADYQRLKTADPTRPVLLNLGQGAAWDGWYGRGRRNHHPEDYPEYLRGCDIASFDIYPVNHDRPEVAGNLWYVAEGVQRLRNWSHDAKPVWACIETTWMDRTGRKPTPHEVRAEVWLALTHGARGIVYFAHQFGPKFIEAALLADSEMLAAVTALNQQITALAPVLNSPTLPNRATVVCENPTAPVALLVKQYLDQTYLFAVALRPGQTRATFTLPGIAASARVEVLGENRSLAATNGTFADAFGAWDVHLYRVATKQTP